MSRGVNKVILVGRLGIEPEMRTMPSGSAVATISLATNESWQDKQTGEWQERTEWHRIVFFGRQAEIVKQYLHKGSQIYVEGRLKTNKWQDKTTGQDRYMTEIVAREMQMLDSRNDNISTNNYSMQSGGNYPPYGSQPGGYSPQPGGYSPPQPPGGYTPQPPSGGYTPQPPPGGYTPQPPSGSYTPPQGNQNMDHTSPYNDTGSGMDTQKPVSSPYDNDEVEQSNSSPTTPPNQSKPPEGNFDEDVPF